MYNNIKLLDCTLREAPIEELYFGTTVITNFVNDMAKANIDIIEIGFLKDGEYKEGSAIFSRVEQIREYCNEKRKDLMIVALVDYGRFSIDNLSEYDGKSIDGIRICFKKHERDLVIEYANKIKGKGYKIFIQQVDTFDYSDLEVLQFIQKINEIDPYALSIVDTFGTLYEDDLAHIFSLVNTNLNKNITIGFHSHNNLQLSNSLIQSFAKISIGQRNVIIDATVCGVGRGAGNANTELVAEFMNKKLNYNYDINLILDTIDINIPAISKKCTWGYCIPYFITGIYNTHVYNVKYLLERHNISSSDLGNIINSLEHSKKKGYDYDYLDSKYFEYFNNSVNDEEVLNFIHNKIRNRKVVLIAPGPSVKNEIDVLRKYINENDTIVISVNWFCNLVNIDYEFYSNKRRYKLRNYKKSDSLKIITSNIKTESCNNEYIVDYSSLIVKNGIAFDKAIILILNLLIKLNVKNVAIAGLDGYQSGINNYCDENLEFDFMSKNFELLNKEMYYTLNYIKPYVERENMDITFITKSRFSDIFQ